MADFDERHPETFGMFGGYFYLNLSSCRMQGVRNPGVTVEQLDMAFFGDHPDVPPYVPHPDDDKPHLVANIEANTAWVMARDTWPEIDDDKATADALRDNRGDLTRYSDEELIERARPIRPLLHHLFEQHTVSGSSAAIGPGILAAVGDAIGDTTIAMKLLAGLGDVDSALPSYALWDMSRKIRASETLTAAFDAGPEGVLDRLRADDSTEAADLLADWAAFIHEFGSRGPNEWDMHADSWETRPALALAALDRVRLQADDESPRLRHDAIAAQRQAVTGEVRARVAADEELAGMVEGALIAANMMAYRERTKTTIVKVIHEGRMIFRELGRRHAEAGNLADEDHIFMLLENEIDDFVADPGSFREPLDHRAADYAALWDGAAVHRQRRHRATAERMGSQDRPGRQGQGRRRCHHLGGVRLTGRGDRDRSCRQRSGRPVRPRPGRHPRGPLHRPVLDAAVHDRGRCRDRCRRADQPCGDREPGTGAAVRHLGHRRHPHDPRRCDHRGRRQHRSGDRARRSLTTRCLRAR
jgi:pyruvate,water dikinase